MQAHSDNAFPVSVCPVCNHTSSDHGSNPRTKISTLFSLKVFEDDNFINHVYIRGCRHCKCFYFTDYMLTLAYPETGSAGVLYKPINIQR